jgi:uncharacterized protein
MNRRYHGNIKEERTMKSVAELRNAKLREALAAIKKEVREIAGDGAMLIVYGSYARGEEQKDSDVDLMVVLPDEKALFPIKDKIRDAIFEIGYDVDFLFSTMIVPESYARKFEGFKVFASVEREGIPV